MLSPSKRQASNKLYPKALVLAIGGGVVFWVTTVATSLLPVAADYRAAGSNWSIQGVWVGSLVAGMVLGACVTYSFLHLFDRIPAKDPVLKAVVLGFVALVVATLLVDVPRSLLPPGPSDALRYFLTGILLNAPRFLLLGAAIGTLYKRLYGQPGLDLTRS
jgi:hypothetical protein